jgi:hypothetical protein
VVPAVGQNLKGGSVGAEEVGREDDGQVHGSHLVEVAELGDVVEEVQEIPQQTGKKKAETTSSAHDTRRDTRHARHMQHAHDTRARECDAYILFSAGSWAMRALMSDMTQPAAAMKSL